MAHVVQLNLESCAKEIAKLKADGIFSDEEVKRIIKENRKLENALASGHQTLDIYKSSIAFFGSIIVTIRQRKGRKSTEWFFINRAVYTYKRGLKVLPMNYHFHLKYHNFLKIFPELNKVTTVHIKDMVGRFMGNPKVFSLAASWYLHINNEVEAKKILFLGQQKHPENLDIYLDLLKIELKHKDDKILDKLTLYMNFIVETKVPRPFLEHTISLIQEQLTETDDVRGVIEYGLNKLLEVYKNEVESYLFAATKTLEANCVANEMKAVKVIDLFRKGIDCLPDNKKPEFSKSYINLISKLIADKGENTHLKFLLLRIIEETLEAKVKLCVQHFVEWIDYSTNDLSVALKMVEENLHNYIDFELVWGLYIKILLMLDRVNDAYEKLHIATSKLEDKAVKVWTIFFNGVLASTTDEKSIRDFFEAGLRVKFPTIVRLVKLRYFSWALSGAKIEDARQLYYRLALQPPYCHELHQEVFRTKHLHCDSNDGSALLLTATKLWKEHFGDNPATRPSTAKDEKNEDNKMFEAFSSTLESENELNVKVSKPWYHASTGFVLKRSRPLQKRKRKTRQGTETPSQRAFTNCVSTNSLVKKNTLPFVKSKKKTKRYAEVHTKDCSGTWYVEDPTMDSVL
ncbi:U3 small nucleolar RNA-associated protein 6 homolog [Euwallacea fornicatus]|uniref:U3 small nucleolar RNA-associated protein 6 homolog n=1 Tax=Euwallacea fornicatus TaxID=995702 RepID=UPI00338DF6CF